MTPERIAELRVLREAGTGGFWRTGRGTLGGERIIQVAGGVDTCPGATVWGELARVTLTFAQDSEGREWYSFGTAEANAKLIVAAVNALGPLLDEVERLRKALFAADEFITNGIEFGFIRMPDAGTPDRAHDTPGIVKAALCFQPPDSRS